MEQLINFIIRPPRAEYNPKNDLLDQEFMLKGKGYWRKDLEVVNNRGDVLQCSHYMPIICPEGNKLPCVIYCHGNSGCRSDASEAAIILLPSNITVFTLDFSGSGLSGGEHVTLGWNEKDDLRAVVDYLRADGNVSLIGLWGRSMGAVTSLMYGAEDPSIAGMVLDSAFSDLVELMMELVDTYKFRFPKFTVAKLCFVPVLFGHAIDDDFIQPHHSDRIFDAYVGDKNIIKFEGDHNSPRPQFYFDSISIFFNNILQPPEAEVGSTYFDLTNDYFSKGRWSTIHDLEFSDELLGPSAGPSATSTEDAIKQLRSKRPMSSMVVPADIPSEDNQPDSQVESRGSGSNSSSSNMISFELSKGSPRGSRVPGSIDDDYFAEYPLDTLADFPTNVEEEERMFIKAVLESLKDLENGGINLPKPEPEPKNEEKDSFCIQSNSVETEPVSTSASDKHKLASLMESKAKPAPKNEPENSSPVRSKSSKTGSVSTSAADEHKLDAHMPLLYSDNILSEPPPKCTLPSEAETQETRSPHGMLDADTMNHSTDSVTVLKNPTSNHPMEEETSGPGRLASHHDVQSGNQSSSDSEMADCTTVTVKVEKNSTNIIDGLLRRWDLNFFRNR